MKRCSECNNYVTCKYVDILSSMISEIAKNDSEEVVIANICKFYGTTITAKLNTMVDIRLCEECGEVATVDYNGAYYCDEHK